MISHRIEPFAMIGGVAVLEVDPTDVFLQRVQLLEESLVERGLDDEAAVIREALRRLSYQADEIDHLESELLQVLQLDNSPG